MAFLNQGGNLECIFVTEAEIIDRFVGDRLWGMGQATSGQLGNNTLSPVAHSSPIQTVSGGTNWAKVAVSLCTAVALKTDGTLWSWGLGTCGSLGNNLSTGNRSSPVQTISGGTNWKDITVSCGHTMAVKTDGTLWGWGSNGLGRLGDNTAVARSSPVQTISGGTNWKSVRAKRFTTAAVKTDGTLWLWGDGFNGILGNGGNAAVSSPVQTIAGGNNWKMSDVSFHGAAVKTDGTLWLWGCNSFGVFGNNSVTTLNSPVQTISGGCNWKFVSVDVNKTAAIKTDGTLWLWGAGGVGGLGDNTSTNKSSPVQTVSGGTNWKTVNVSISTSGAIKTDGTLWLWGNGSYGELGNNCGGGVNTTRSSPVQTITGGRNWKDLAVGCRITLAVTHSN